MARPHKEHALGWVSGQIPGIRPKCLFVGVVIPGLAIVGGVAADPNWMTFEVLRLEFAET